MNTKTKEMLTEIIGLTIGCFIMSVGINMFLSPHTIALGGLSGLSVVLNKVTGISVSTIMLGIGLPLLLCSVKILGKRDALKTFIGMNMLSFFISLTSPLSAVVVTNDILLSSICGAILLGSGIGIVFSVDGSTGGTVLIALMINRVMPRIPLAKCLTVIDGLVVLSSGLVSQNLEIGLYSALGLFVMTKMIDVIISGLERSKSFMIITQEEELLKKAIVNDMNRGVTVIDGKGGYTDSSKSILLVVVRKDQEVHLKKLIKKIDPSAFIIVSDVHEVLGEGFKELSV